MKVTPTNWNPVDIMSYSFVDFVTCLVSTERKFDILDIIVLNKLTLTQSSKLVSALCGVPQSSMNLLIERNLESHPN